MVECQFILYICIFAICKCLLVGLTTVDNIATTVHITAISSEIAGATFKTKNAINRALYQQKSCEVEGALYTVPLRVHG